MEKIGPYSIIRPIAKGGMGEVLLVFDPVCERSVALKRIRHDLKDKGVIKQRLLKEAKLTSKLTHPGIIGIYSIHEENDELYYTMPFVEGMTLRQLIRGHDNSISSLLPYYRSVCQTIAYAHSKGILHRDIKPENILVGNFGEVILLDWGLAETAEGEDPEEPESIDLTLPGKIVGTLAFMAPERALGAPASFQTDIYALGVILYQILTLELPFHRPSLKEFRSRWMHESLSDPEEIAPYRDVPPRLSRIVKKSLCRKPEDRYGSVDELLNELNAHLEGRAEWFEMARLNLKKKEAWEFQENLLLSKHIAIAGAKDTPEWVMLSVSSQPFVEPLRLETTIELKKECRGIGFLLNIPESGERETPFDGHLLWLGNEEQKVSSLYRNSVEVTQIPDLYLSADKKHELIIEKVDKSIRIIIDGTHRFTYLSYLPLIGTRIGVLSRDMDYEMDEIILYAGSTQLQISCLAIPDAFLAAKDFKRALAEYRRIAASFPGHLEGREALFRSGIALLEEAKAMKSAKKALHSFSLALEEFSKMHNTPGAPLEYLGKSLVYEALFDREEEVKCLELALCRYANHPLISAIKERLLYRMYESASKDRLSAYQLVLISLRHLPEVLSSTEALHLFRHLITYAEKLPFFEIGINPELLDKEIKTKLQFEIELSFWAALPHAFLEIFDEILLSNPFEVALLGNVLFSLYVLGANQQAENLLLQLEEKRAHLSEETEKDLSHLIDWLSPLRLYAKSGDLEKAVELYLKLPKECIGTRELRCALWLIEEAIMKEKATLVEFITVSLLSFPLGREDQILIDSYRLWMLLWQKRLSEAGDIFEHYPYELLNQETTPLHPLYGCYLLLTEGEELAKIFFAGVTDTLFPRSWALLGHELTNHLTQKAAWLNTAFLYEKRRLYRQLILYYHCLGNQSLLTHVQELEKEQTL